MKRLHLVTDENSDYTLMCENCLLEAHRIALVDGHFVCEYCATKQAREAEVAKLMVVDEGDDFATGLKVGNA